MAPMLLDHPEQEEVASKTIPICSDASVVVSEVASRRTKELWWMHGHPHSKRYSDPALNSLSALVRHDGVVFKDQTACLYPLSSDPATKYETMTWNELDKATEVLAFSYAHHLKNELEEANASQKQPTIALLGGGRTIEYFCTQLALQKLGVRVLLLAESNAQNALHHLLKTCDALAVITDNKNTNTDTNGVRKVDMVEALPKSPEAKPREVDVVKFQDFDDVWERPTFIIHSSGSTGMPKPIIHTNRSMMLIARMYRLFQEFEVDNWFLLFPLYHIAGISIALSNLPNGKVLSFPPLSWPPSSSTIFSAWSTLSSIGHPVDITHCAPTLIENMYEYITSTTKDFTPLTSLKVLQPGGAALSSSIVNALVAAGVNVKTTYGSTEIGPPMRTIPHSRSNTKCYTFRNLYPDSPFLKMEQVGEGLYECVVYKGFELAAELWIGKPDNEPYRTNDLFIQDPPGSGNFVLQGRKDDILVHSNGENTSAGPLQLDIQTSSKYIVRALALGHSRPCVALLIELHEGVDPCNDDVKDKVWETVKQVNACYPGHSQIMRSMIHFLPSGATLPITPKGNVKRKEAERIYESAISALYDDDGPLPQLGHSSKVADEPQQPLAEFLRHLIASLCNTPPEQINDWTTLYELGIDSKHALSLRSALAKHLSRPISLSTIFENPSISQLASALSPSAPSSITAQTQPNAIRSSSTENANRLISRLETEIRSWPSRSSSTSDPRASYTTPERETILLTGASGSLGTALLETLSASPRVERIYALIRGPHHLEKLRIAMQERGLDASLLNVGGKVTVMNLSMQDPLLGLSVEEYFELAQNVTIVLQNAWKMDFNQGVEEFEGDCIRSTMSLLRLCHAGRPKTMAFTSSVSTCMGPGHTAPAVEEVPIGPDPTVALNTGYALSKYVVERLTQTASSHLSLPIKLLRVGQLSGHTRTSRWNTSEMWPIMFATSLHPAMRCIPSFPAKTVDWVPVDIAARTVTEILVPEQQTSNGAEKKGGAAEPHRTIPPHQEWGTEYAVHNITNPHPIPWSSLVTMLQQADSSHSPPISEVPMSAWVARLNALADLPALPALPGLRLLNFFENMAASTSSENEASKLFLTRKTERVSSALRECPAFCQAWITGNVSVWRELGFVVASDDGAGDVAST